MNDETREISTEELWDRLMGDLEPEKCTLSDVRENVMRWTEDDIDPRDRLSPAQARDAIERLEQLISTVLTSSGRVLTVSEVQAARMLMDDDLAERATEDVAGESLQVWWDRYCELHKERFGLPFTPDAGGAW